MKIKYPLRTAFRTAFVASGLLGLLARSDASDAPSVVHLWENGAPGFESKKDVPEVPVQWGIAGIQNPSLTVFLPPAGTATGAAAVILPGGGNRMLVVDMEGYALARWLASKGIAGFVLKYRLAKDQTMDHSPYRVDVEGMQDTARALRLVRGRAAEWGVDPKRIGIIGFSAGGHLAAMAAIHFDSGNPDAADPVDRASSRPAFQALVYPGEPDEIRPAKDSPPAFLVAGSLDDLSDGLSRAWLLFKKAGVPVELHIYSGVGHAFNFRPNPHTVGTWGDRLYDWIADNGFLKATG